MSNSKNTISIPWLDAFQPVFPDTQNALPYPQGLLAAGGNLYPETLLEAYKKGIFPWFNENEPILWWTPDPRCLLIPDEFHCSRSLIKSIRKNDFRIKFDHAFEAVIQACAERSETWISDEIIFAYTELHRQGHAHSVEVYKQQELVGGLYGLAIGKAFFGESMYSRCADASKFALMALSDLLASHGYHFIDCQQETDHLLSLGASLHSRELFEQSLQQAVSQTGLKLGSWSQFSEF